MPVSLAIFISVVAFTRQNHNFTKPEQMTAIWFLKGQWSGKQDFNVPGQKMVCDQTDQVDAAIGDRYLEEILTTTLPSGRKGQARHMITFDAKQGVYKAWWFDDTRVGPMELIGKMDGNTLVFQNEAPGAAPSFKATYTKVSDSELKYSLEMKNGDSWQELFHSSLTKSN